jgi:hypothetical protein
MLKIVVVGWEREDRLLAFSNALPSKEAATREVSRV